MVTDASDGSPDRLRRSLQPRDGMLACRVPLALSGIQSCQRKTNRRGVVSSRDRDPVAGDRSRAVARSRAELGKPRMDPTVVRIEQAVAVRIGRDHAAEGSLSREGELQRSLVTLDRVLEPALLRKRSGEEAVSIDQIGLKRQ